MAASKEREELLRMLERLRQAFPLLTGDGGVLTTGLSKANGVLPGEAQRPRVAGVPGAAEAPGKPSPVALDSGSGAREEMAGLVAPLTGLLAGTAARWSVADDSGDKRSPMAAVGKFFVSGLGLVQGIRGLAGLFGGREDREPPPLVRYQAPGPIRIEAGLLGSGEIRAIDRGQDGGLRVLPARFGESERDGRERALPPIQIQVQAMDSQSFLDRSEDIARAVREAILRSHALVDTLAEL